MIVRSYPGFSGSATGTGAKDMTIVGAAMMAAAPATGPAAPFVLAAGIIVTVLGKIGIGGGCGSNCTQATAAVQSAEPTLRNNVAGYEQGLIDQATAQNNYNQIWAAVESACAIIPGAAGTNCTGDRQQGSCKYKQTANPEYPGEPALGDCWNWYEAYYSPLTLPSLVPYSGESSTGTDSISSLVSSLTSSPILLIGGLIAVAMMAD
jgi:hypothetical protein